MKKIFFRFLDSMKDKHGEYNMSIIYLMVSVAISLLLGVGLLYQLQERYFLEDEIVKLQENYNNLETKSQESINNYNSLKTEKENLQNDYNELQSELEEKDSFLEIAYQNISTLEDSMLNYKNELSNTESKLEILLDLLVGNNDILQKYYDATRDMNTNNIILDENQNTKEQPITDSTEVFSDIQE